MKKNRKKCAYISGGMRGVLNHRDIFHHAEVELQAQGFETFNPAAKEKEVKLPGETPLQYLRKVFFLDCQYICKKATHIAMLPLWESSLGAQAEIALAKAIGLEIIYLRATPIKKVRASTTDHEYRIGKENV
jgi:Domain of unknown function (DUF4406)